MLVKATGVFFDARVDTTCTSCSFTFVSESPGTAARFAAFSAIAFMQMNAVNPKRIFFIPFFNF